MSNNSASEDRIRDEAYRLWEQAGRPHGREAEFWHQAVDLVYSEPPAPASASQAVAAEMLPAAAALSVKPRKKAAKPEVAAAPPGRRGRKNGAQPPTPST